MMALRTVLDAETFKMATLNLVWLNNKEEFDPQTFQDAAIVLRILVDDGQQLASRTDTEVVRAVDKVLRRFVPDYVDWSDASLRQFLCKKAQFLEGLTEGKAPQPAGLRRTHELCESMWATLAHIKNQDLRNSALS